MESLTGWLTSWDWLVLVVGALSTCFGLWRGAVRTLFGLGAWIVGVLAAPVVVSAVTGLPGTDSVPVWVQFIAAFLVAFIAVRLAGNLLLRGVRSIGLGGVDRVFGGALGVARAGLIVLVAALVGYRMGLAQDAAWQQARSRPLLDWMVAQVDPLLPATPGPAGGSLQGAAVPAARLTAVQMPGAHLPAALVSSPIAIICLSSALPVDPHLSPRGA